MRKSHFLCCVCVSWVCSISGLPGGKWGGREGGAGLEMRRGEGRGSEEGRGGEVRRVEGRGGEGRGEGRGGERGGVCLSNDVWKKGQVQCAKD